MGDVFFGWWLEAAETYRRMWRGAWHSRLAILVVPLLAIASIATVVDAYFLALDVYYDSYVGSTFIGDYLRDVLGEHTVEGLTPFLYALAITGIPGLLWVLGLSIFTIMVIGAVGLTALFVR